jgi:hypothetical protein
MHLVDVIKHKETGHKYAIPNGDPLPSDMYIRLVSNISPDEAKTYTNTPLRITTKAKC